MLVVVETFKRCFIQIFEARQLHSKATAIIKDLEECSKDSSTNGDKIDGLKVYIPYRIVVIKMPKMFKLGIRTN